MKLLQILIIIYSIISITLSKSCTQNSDCPPNESCAKSLNFIKGIGYDGYNDDVLVIGKYNDVNNKPFGLPSMFSVPRESDNDKTIVKKFDIYGEILDGPNYTNIFNFYGYLSLSNKYYIGITKTSSPYFSIYNDKTAKIEPIINIFNTPFVYDADEVDNRFVYGEYNIGFLNHIPTKKEDFSNPTILYQNQMANGISFDGFLIYISTYDGKLFEGNTGCVNCSKDKLKLLVSDSDIQNAGSLLLSNGFLYFSYANGIKGYPIDGNKTKVKQLVKEKGINSMTLSIDKNTLFYITNIGSIKSISTNINNPKVKTLYTPKAINQCLSN